jgi:aspartate kinase
VSIIVQKYGGSSVATIDKLKKVASLVCERKEAGHDMVVVVSAMGDTTDELLEKAKLIAKEPDRRELDMLLSVGERVSMALLAIAVREAGFEAVSLTGSQSGIMTTASHTNARIMEVRPFRVQDELEHGKIVIVAGYQGVSYKREITTLGRGGSDTTAVALAAALDAEACEIYSDVDGVLTTDPRVVSDASHLPEIGYAEMQELAEAGAKVLNAQAVEFAKQKGIAIYAKKTGSSHPGTVVRHDVPAPSSGVRGLAHQKEVLWVESSRELDAHQLPRLLSKLDELNAHPKQIAHSVRKFSCVINLDDVHARPTLESIIDEHLGERSTHSGRGAVSLIGEGITRDASVLSRALEVLRGASIPVSALSTSSFRITALLPTEAVENAVRLLHAAFDLAQKPGSSDKA